MSQTYNDFLVFNDFSLIEKAIQSFFCADALGASFAAPLDDDDPNRETWSAGPDHIAFYTAFQALTFQQCRPRVYISLSGISRVPGAYAVDGNGNLREKAWMGTGRLGIVSDPNYIKHMALRSLVLSILPQVLGQIAPDNSLFAGTGVNALLQYHQVSEFWARDVSTSVTPEQGNYQSIIPVQVAFSVNPAAWPSGMTTT